MDLAGSALTIPIASRLMRRPYHSASTQTRGRTARVVPTIQCRDAFAATRGPDDLDVSRALDRVRGRPTSSVVPKRWCQHGAVDDAMQPAPHELTALLERDTPTWMSSGQTLDRRNLKV